MRNTMTQATCETGKWITKRKARDLFLAARLNEREMYPGAVRYHDEHGAWPSEYVQAQQATARAFEKYVNASRLFGITVEV